MYLQEAMDRLGARIENASDRMQEDAAFPPMSHSLKG